MSILIAFAGYSRANAGQSYLGCLLGTSSDAMGRPRKTRKQDILFFGGRRSHIVSTLRRGTLPMHCMTCCFHPTDLLASLMANGTDLQSPSGCQLCAGGQRGSRLLKSLHVCAPPLPKVCFFWLRSCVVFVTAASGNVQYLAGSLPLTDALACPSTVEEGFSSELLQCSNTDIVTPVHFSYSCSAGIISCAGRLRLAHFFNTQ